MSNDAVSKIAQHLQLIEKSVATLIAEASPQALNRTNSDDWSALDFLKHLLLSLKSVVKAGEMPRETLIQSFGTSGRKSDSYSVIVEKYDRRLEDGIRAEDVPAMAPRGYRIPAGTRDEKQYLLEQWADAHQRLYKVIEGYSSINLDMVQLPHPAIGLITFREMLYFTIYHNTIHWQDIETMVKRGTK